MKCHRFEIQIPLYSFIQLIREEWKRKEKNHKQKTLNISSAVNISVIHQFSFWKTQRVFLSQGIALHLLFIVGEKKPENDFQNFNG